MNKNNGEKEIFVISILGNNILVMYDDDKVILRSFAHEDSLEYKVSEYIGQQLSNHGYSKKELRNILTKVQIKINLSNEQDMLDNMQKYFLNITPNVFYNQEEQIQITNSIIDELKKQKEQIMYASGIIPEEVNNTLNDELEEGQERGRQRVYSNGHSTLESDKEKKNAFTSALVLALLVEIFGLVIFTLLLIKII